MKKWKDDLEKTVGKKTGTLSLTTIKTNCEKLFKKLKKQPICEDARVHRVLNSYIEQYV